jgi:tetratricopeptide (TPR) repeat protein
MAWSNSLLGNYEQALTYCQKALQLLGEHGDRSERGAIQHTIGYAHHHLGEYVAAVAFYRDALHNYTITGDRVSEATTLTHLADTQLALGNLDAVAASWRHALEILDDLGRPAPANLRARLNDLETTGGQPD